MHMQWILLVKSVIVVYSTEVIVHNLEMWHMCTYLYKLFSLFFSVIEGHFV